MKYRIVQYFKFREVQNHPVTNFVEYRITELQISRKTESFSYKPQGIQKHSTANPIKYRQTVNKNSHYKLCETFVDCFNSVFFLLCCGPFLCLFFVFVCLYLFVLVWCFFAFVVCFGNISNNVLTKCHYAMNIKTTDQTYRKLHIFLSSVLLIKT